MGHLEEFSRWPAQRFIETGVGEGKTLAAAAQVYAECISIELHPVRHKAAVERFNGFSNVSIYYGNSPDILRKVVDPKISTVFWLDAHFVKGDADWKNGTAPKEHGLCPLVEELQIIKDLEWATKPVILIDDWSTFRLTDFGWPTLASLDELMGVKHQRFTDLPGGDVFGYVLPTPAQPAPMRPRADVMADVRLYLPPVLREELDRANAELEKA
jgi:hypothetical protein